MTETTKKRGRPVTGALSPLENKLALTARGGRITQYRIKPAINQDLLYLEASGEFETTTEALDTAITEAAKRRRLREARASRRLLTVDPTVPHQPP